MSDKLQHEEEKKKLSIAKFSPERGDNFKKFIYGLLLNTAKLPKDRADEYIKHIRVFEQAFTSRSFNTDWNYEALEILGDSISNFCVVQYLSIRFPQLMNPNGSGVGTLARLKINLVSKTIFSQCAEKLGFADHIASDLLTRKDQLTDLLEDTFEAFQGAILQVISLCDPQGARKGYLPPLGPSYRIIMNCLDSIEISLKYDDLYDAKTRLKQLLETVKLSYPKFKYSQELDAQRKIVFTTIVCIPQLGDYGQGTGFYKNISEQNACEQTIQNLKKAGYIGKKHDL
jgi:dsRNA-specific ribonuclease